MVIVVRIKPEIKIEFRQFQTESGPDESARAKFRVLKPEECPKCRGRSLQGHGWRCRSVLKSWAEWGVVWFWRVSCRICRSVHCLMADIVIPDLLYGSKVVGEVIAGRLTGEPAKTYEPHRRTQKRWMDRLSHWWPSAQSAGAIEGELKEWTSSASKLMEGIWKCAAHHIGLLFPSRSERLRSGVLPRRKYPAIATHQTCLSTEELRL